MLTVGTVALQAQTAGLQIVDEPLPNPDNEPAPVQPVPHPRQVKWMQTEFYAFYHYGMNTFTGKEWGNGDEAENLYNPTQDPNPKQWLEAAKSAGMKGGIAVVKHHDGFCLWPTATTTHSIASSGNAHSGVNIPEAFAAAAKELGLKYGFYISPWDRNSAYYGDGTDRYVTEVFLKQCKELALYGDDQFEMWFDGANGGSGYYGGKGGSRTIDRATYYDVPNLRDMVHGISPNCVLWGVGGEARWIGNEAGYAGPTNWCPLNRGGNNTNAILNSGSEDGWMWLPGESDAKSTNGWFWATGHTVKSKSELFTMYLETVGRNPWVMCTNLKKFDIADGAEHFAVLDSCLYYTENGQPYRFTAMPPARENKVVHLRPGTKAMGDQAFRLTNVTEIYAPEGLTTVETNSCLSCAQLEKVELPTTVETLEPQAFGGCTALNHIQILAAVPPTLTVN